MTSYNLSSWFFLVQVFLKSILPGFFECQYYICHPSFFSCVATFETTTMGIRAHHHDFFFIPSTFETRMMNIYFFLLQLSKPCQRAVTCHLGFFSLQILLKPRGQAKNYTRCFGFFSCVGTFETTMMNVEFFVINFFSFHLLFLLDILKPQW